MNAANYWLALDDDVRSAVASIDTRKQLRVEDLPRLRRERAQRYPEPSSALSHADYAAADFRSSHAARVRVHRPAADAEARPALVWIHGGGYILNSDLADEDRLDRWVEEHNCVVASVDYRLAPEHPYPAALDDCYAGLRWLSGHAAEIGVDVRRIVLAGLSAGGGLAAASALMARDRGDVGIAALLLVYPMLEDRDLGYPSRMIESNVWGPQANQFGWRCYLGSKAGQEEVPVYAAPGRVSELTGLPPTFIGIAGQDVLRDEDLSFADRLVRSGVRTEVHLYSGAPHGFERSAPRANVSRRFVRDIDEFLTAAFRLDALAPAELPR